MRATYEMNMGVWKGLVEQSEENFFKLFKQSPFWNDDLEGQMREAWQGLKKAQTSQFDILRTQWEKMEDLLRGIG
jgi:hypothetical protein